ncbi:hypothetical protein DLM45_03290 [Hyphomicrobium methylovorum]|uniref:hypothetical protein n=1 Tax=Hyphomicrobium methylovorum TaxID=84 RepID=UPI0015E69DE7|nr:hypothetical protein [Hyphomicrobium methylovorum]MBA2125248.1 hypothetical protein [Hyphomicrobium methylovorum]
MSTDYAEKEREFVAGLHEDTGRDLAAWMAAISASGHNERNAIIDWLRHQGFQFAWASWLERIHYNGGRLIYADATGNGLPRDRPVRAGAVVDDEPPRRERLQPTHVPTASQVTAAQPTSGDGVAELLATAKGLRPLADLILREVRQTVPDVMISVKGPLVIMAAPTAFAALFPQPKMLRLFGRFGPAGAGRVTSADLVMKAPAPFPEMLALDDARSVDSDFRQLILAAAGR